MALARDIGLFLLMACGVVGWIVLGLLVLTVAPFIIGMVLIGAVVFAPEMEGY